MGKNNIIFSNLTITRITPLDVEQIQNILFASNTTILSEGSLKQDLLDCNCYIFIAKLNDNVVGFASIKDLIDHSDIDYIYVLENYRNKGIGKLLLNKLLKQASDLNISDILLEVRISNIVAHRLYENFGFEKISTRKNYYILPVEDAFIYRKLIK